MMAPATVDEAMNKLGFLREPKTIRIKKEGKYTRVIAWGFPKEGVADDDEIPF